MADDTRHVGHCPEVTCTEKVKVATSRDSFRNRLVDYHDGFPANLASLYPPDSPVWNFLPLMSRQEKMSQLHILDVLVELLDGMDVDYFLVNGALLGVVRHRGIIPWDDDLDICILKDNLGFFLSQGRNIWFILFYLHISPFYFSC